MKLRAWFLLPAWLWMAVLFAAPLAHRAGVQLPDARRLRRHRHCRGPCENYQRLVDPLYLTILLRSFVMAAAATALCLLLAFPAALFISRATDAARICTCSW